MIIYFLFLDKWPVPAVGSFAAKEKSGDQIESLPADRKRNAKAVRMQVVGY